MNQGVVRLELGNPCPDCFGMKKSFLVCKAEFSLPQLATKLHKVMGFAAWK